MMALYIAAVYILCCSLYCWLVVKLLKHLSLLKIWPFKWLRNLHRNLLAITVFSSIILKKITVNSFSSIILKKIA